jgi:cyanate lyase
MPEDGALRLRLASDQALLRAHKHQDLHYPSLFHLSGVRIAAVTAIALTTFHIPEAYSRRLPLALGLNFKFFSQTLNHD